MKTQRQRIGWIAAGLALVLILTGVGLLALRASRSPNATPAAGAGSPGGPTPTPTSTPTPDSTLAPPGSDLAGPLNVLIAGIDTRVTIKGWQPHADAVLLLHVPVGLERGYLFSLPRDLRVDVPAYPAAGFRGGRMKLTESITRGSRVPGSDRIDVPQGLGLLTQTVSGYTGIEEFDAAAVLTFGGLSRLTDALGGVTLRIDQTVVSQHMRPDGKHRARRPGGGGYLGPQMIYRPGTRRLVGWQAIDYARQRYTAGGDYTRQRHQQQLIKALVDQAADTGLAADPTKTERVLQALGDTLTFDGLGRSPVAFAYALRELRAEDLTLIGLPGASVGVGNSYRGEQLRQTGRDFLEAVVDGEVAAFVKAHPKLVNKS